MKILFITGSLNQGGAEFQILALAKLFKEKGNEVEVLAITEYNFYYGFVKSHNLTYTHLKNNESKVKRIFLTKKKINNYRPDWVISFLRQPSIVALLCKLIPGSKFRLLISERTSLVLPWYDKFYFNFSLVSNRITTNSISKFLYIKNRFPLLKKRTFFVPNIIELARFTKAADTRQVANLCRISFVGRISPEKNLISLIKSLSFLVK